MKRYILFKIYSFKESLNINNIFNITLGYSKYA